MPTKLALSVEEQRPPLENPEWADEKRREIRLRRSQLLEHPEEVCFTYKIATSRNELDESFRLVWSTYVKVGLQSPDTPPLRFTKYHLIPSTKVFVALARPELAKANPDYKKLTEPGEVVGTLTLIADSDLGLPMEEVCRQSVQRIRDEGGQPAEVIGLAVNPKFRSRNLMMYLYRLMFEYARLSGVSDILCSVTKRHIRFYRSMLLFKPMGRLKRYGPANGQEVQCHRLNIGEARAVAEEVYHSQHFDADLYTFFFTDNPTANRQKGAGGPWEPDTIQYFLEKQTKVKSELSESELVFFRATYEAHGAVFPY